MSEQFIWDTIKFANWQSALYTEETMIIIGMETDHLRGCLYQNKEILSGRIKNADGKRIYQLGNQYVILADN